MVDTRLAIRLEAEEDPITHCELTLKTLFVSILGHPILSALLIFMEEVQQGILVTKCCAHEVD